MPGNIIEGNEERTLILTYSAVLWESVIYGLGYMRENHSIK
jgi:hypothetical protein